jgi:hypothetical protein
MKGGVGACAVLVGDTHVWMKVPSWWEILFVGTRPGGRYPRVDESAVLVGDTVCRYASRWRYPRVDESAVLVGADTRPGALVHSKAWFKSHIISSTFSRPTEMRIISGDTPPAN